MNTWVTRALPVIALIAALTPVAARAQSLTPSYATPVDSIKGTISHFDGATTMYVRDERGYIDTVTLHKGTIINPTGIKLEPGYAVTVTGEPDGSTFVANEIDTPYHFVSVPYYPYAYDPYLYGPLPYYGLGFGWGWHRWR